MTASKYSNDYAIHRYYLMHCFDAISTSKDGVSDQL